jgi:hypothetical protein
MGWDRVETIALAFVRSIFSNMDAEVADVAHARWCRLRSTRACTAVAYNARSERIAAKGAGERGIFDAIAGITDAKPATTGMRRRPTLTPLVP